jgi:acyl-CoA thioester hydrolase
MIDRSATAFPGAITYCGIVNTPECDENGHMNVQFYWSKFEKADRQFRLVSGLGDTLAFPRVSRHVRYHAELHGAYGLHIVSRFVADAAGTIMLLHDMIDSDRDRLSATALDRLLLDPAVETAIRARGEIPEVPAKALPRSLQGPDPDFGLSEAAWADAGAVLTCRTLVEPHLTDAGGEMTDRGLVALSVEAAPASWSYGGFPQPVLTRRGLGRVALEKRVFVHRRPRSGDLVHVLSRLIAVERVTFSVRHQYYDSQTHEFLAVCEVTLLPLDLTSRKAVPLPDDVRAHMQALIGL